MLSKNISLKGIEFVESTLAYPPERRVAAKEALDSEWLRPECGRAGSARSNTPVATLRNTLQPAIESLQAATPEPAGTSTPQGADRPQEHEPPQAAARYIEEEETRSGRSMSGVRDFLQGEARSRSRRNSSGPLFGPAPSWGLAPLASAGLNWRAGSTFCFDHLLARCWLSPLRQCGSLLSPHFSPSTPTTPTNNEKEREKCK